MWHHIKLRLLIAWSFYCILTSCKVKSLLDSKLTNEQMRLFATAVCCLLCDHGNHRNYSDENDRGANFTCIWVHWIIYLFTGSEQTDQWREKVKGQHPLESLIIQSGPINNVKELEKLANHFLYVKLQPTLFGYMMGVEMIDNINC